MFSYIILFILGLCFGSFSTVLISRWKSGQGGIMMGRSECPHCKHTLTALELIPLISWIVQMGRCKNCKTKIPYYYPISELIMGAIFVLMGWISMNLGFPIVSIFTFIFLFWGFITIIYIIYDIRYMEIPDQALIPAILVTVIVLLVGLIGEDYRIFFDYLSYKDFHTFLTDHIIASIFLYTFFFLQILIPGSIYYIKSGKGSKILGLLLSYFIFPFTILIEYLQGKNESNGEDDEIPVWVGGGDLRIAIFIGLSLGTLHAISTLIFAYIIGSIVGIIILAYGRINKRSVSHMIPFGPFLGAGWFLSLIFYDAIISYSEIINI